MEEHDTVEVVRDTHGHLAGVIGTIVGRSDGHALIEFADEDGRALALDDIPLDALRPVGDRHAA